MEGHAPFSGVWDARYAQSIRAADVADDGLTVRECNNMSSCDDVMNADKCCAIAVGDHR